MRGCGQCNAMQTYDWVAYLEAHSGAVYDERIVVLNATGQCSSCIIANLLAQRRKREIDFVVGSV